MDCVMFYLFNQTLKIIFQNSLHSALEAKAKPGIVLWIFQTFRPEIKIFLRLA